MGHFLDSFFYPKSVAVVGATNNSRTISYNLLGNLVRLKFDGKMYPVNPNAAEVMGIKAYPSVTSIEETPEMVVIAIPAARTIQVVRECIARKVKAIVLVSGGFSETGKSGKKMQDEILGMLRESGTRAIGPNVLGPINTANNLSISFHPLNTLPRGKVSFIFQSGLYEPRLNWLQSEFGLHLNKVIDLGNKMDVSEVDALEYLSGDPGSEVIAIHMESITGNAREFMRLLKETAKRKPVVVLKSGRTAEGATAASSHTGAIMKSTDAVFDAVLKQCGAIRAQSLDDFFDWAKIFEYYGHLGLKGNRIALASGSGGEGVITTDCAQFNGLTLARVSSKTYEKLRPVFPGWDIEANPFDIGVAFQFHGTIEAYGTYFNAMAEDENVDCLATQVTRHAATEGRFVEIAYEVLRKGKPLVFWTATPSGFDGIASQLQARGIPVYPTSERAVKALAALGGWGATPPAAHSSGLP
ncbi:MAG: CoA-binding protein [Chloroflexi bacterium]|nr:CoA-binding protein [Chloroflexota bacterium]